IPVVVADCGQDRSVRRQRQRGDRRTIVMKPREHLAGDVLRVAGAAAIAGEQNLAAVAQRGHDNFGDALDRSGEHRVFDRRLYHIARSRQVFDGLAQCRTCHVSLPRSEDLTALPLPRRSSEARPTAGRSPGSTNGLVAIPGAIRTRATTKGPTPVLQSPLPSDLRRRSDDEVPKFPPFLTE